jgi:drug/metabolite transporter (DMT)-like permease
MSQTAAPVSGLPVIGRAELWARMLFCAMMWSSGFLFMRLLTGSVTPIAMAGARAAIAALLLTTFFVVRGESPLPRRHEAFPFLVLGTLNGWMPNILTAFALTQISTASSAMIQASGPLMVAVIAHFAFAEERLSLVRFFGVVMGFCGMGLLIGPDAFAFGSASNIGALAMTLVAASYALGNLYTRRVRAIAPLRLALGQQWCSGLVALPLAWLIDGPAALMALFDHLVPVLALGSVSTAIPISFFMVLISKAGPTRAAMVGYLMPIFATGLSIAFLGEHVGLREIAGGVIILTGVWFATSKR